MGHDLCSLCARRILGRKYKISQPKLWGIVSVICSHHSGRLLNKEDLICSMCNVSVNFHYKRNGLTTYAPKIKQEKNMNTLIPEETQRNEDLDVPSTVNGGNIRGQLKQNIAETENMESQVDIQLHASQAIEAISPPLINSKEPLFETQELQLFASQAIELLAPIASNHSLRIQNNVNENNSQIGDQSILQIESLPMDVDLSENSFYQSQSQLNPFSEEISSFRASEADCTVPQNSQVSYCASEFAEKLRTGTIPIVIPGISSVSATQRRCFICRNVNKRSTIPVSAILDFWIRKQIFIPLTNRCCPNHLENNIFKENDVKDITVSSKCSELTGKHISKFLKGLTSLLIAKSQPLDFSIGSPLTNEHYKRLLGVTHENFDEMLDYCNGKIRNSSNRTTRNALAMLLIKMRLDLSQSIIAFLFGIPNQSTVSQTITSVLNALKPFVQKHLGFAHKSREQLHIDHMKTFFTSILGRDPGSLVLIMDGTYIYVQKLSDFEAQRKTWSLHKHRNLVKAMIIVAPDGYYIDVTGLYFADSGNNDAKIMEEMLANSQSISSILEPGDTVVLDRGFREILKGFKAINVKTFMPSFLDKGQQQFTWKEANESRQVTILRWVVESANGRLKNIFKFFDHIVQVTYIPKLIDLIQTACAIINAFCPPLFTQTEKHEEMVEAVLEKLRKKNDLQIKVEEEELYRKQSVAWEECNEDCVLEFPTLSMEDLQKITLGPYQLNIGENYNQEHMKTNGSYKFYLHRESEDLIRVKLQSRHCKKRTYLLWVHFNQLRAGISSILGWYCKCKVGARTLGCCSHVAAVLRYLGHDRFEQSKPHRDLVDTVLDAAACLMEMEANGVEGETSDESVDEDIYEEED